MNTSITVDPKDVTISNVVVSVELVIGTLILGSSIDVNVLFRNQQGRIFKSELVHIQGDEYNQWGNDDNYLIDLVLSKVGLTRINLSI